MGSWALEHDALDTTGVHAAVLPDFSVLYWSYDERDENNVDRCKWQLWDEAGGPVEPSARILNRNLFCSGHCWLGDGRLLVAGGQSWNWITQGIWGADHDLHTFDPKNRSWSRHENMPGGRYYPTCVTLPDGNAFIASGAHTRVPSNALNHEYEVFDARTNKLSPRRPFNPGFMRADELYPFFQLIADGSAGGLIWVHSGRESRLFSPGASKWLPPTFRVTGGGNRNYPRQGAAVILPLREDEGFRTRILLVGGGEEGTASATDSAQIFEFDRANPEKSAYRLPNGGRQLRRRFMGDAILLADGSVLVCGGAGEGAADHSHEPVMDCEIFDPGTEAFRLEAPINRKRMYHASAVLLPSGRVALAGHTEHWNPSAPSEDRTVEIFTPDYLSRGDQPRLLDAPEVLTYGQSIGLRTPDAEAIGEVALVRASSVTHTNNMDQRWVGLLPRQDGPDTVRALIPRDRTILPPGPYLVFLLSREGVPSTARAVRLDPYAPSPGRVLAVDRWFSVPESSSLVETGILLLPGDDFEIEAEGEIHAGVAATGHNGPEGWHNVDHNKKFPLHAGGSAHPYSLIGRFAGQPWFYIGKRIGPVSFKGGQPDTIELRTNDDVPGNGKGSFSCNIKVWRDAASVSAQIVRVVANPEGRDTSVGEGEYVLIRNAASNVVSLTGWRLVDSFGHQLRITKVLDIQPGSEIEIHTGPGSDTSSKVFAGRRSAIWNNEGDTVFLKTPDGQVMDQFKY
jgi:hypothetical protein